MRINTVVWLFRPTYFRNVIRDNPAHVFFMVEIQRNIAVPFVLVVVFIFLFGLILITSLLSFARRRKKLFLHEQLMESRFREELLRSVLEMQEHTFQSVSREIHDNVGQLLSLAKLNLNILSLEQVHNDKLLAIKELVANAIDELRYLGSAYHADSVIDSGLVPAIEYQVHQIQRTGLFNVSYFTAVDQISISKSSRVLLYRVIQESFNNIIRHSAATLIRVGITEEVDGLHIRIEDNGKGFDRSSPAHHKGIGLKSMEQRVAMTGATLEIKSEPGKGTSIIIILNKKI